MEEEVDEVENKKTVEKLPEKSMDDGEKSEDDVSVHSTCNSNERERNIENSAVDLKDDTDEVQVKCSIVPIIF